ncbi:MULTISPECIES: hypothetical protein [Streptomyces]|uniref:hypothetical protein n=1 Tax=Streptomyces sp. H-KF8 TaxID=1727216 RepID=UPI000ACAFD2A|nr:hypothetical protein [Streptomyces sp. H-KF8]
MTGEEFRANAGKVGGPFEGGDLLSDAWGSESVSVSVPVPQAAGSGSSWSWVRYMTEL